MNENQKSSTVHLTLKKEESDHGQRHLFQNGGYHQSYLSANEIRSLKDAPEDDVFGTVRKDGQKWITTSPLTEEEFRFKSRILAITRLRNHLRKEMLK